MPLNLRSLDVAFGPVRAVRGVSLSVAAGEVAAVIGPNGAGKTSLLAAAMGLVPGSGSVKVDDAEIGNKAAHLRSRAGLGYVPSSKGVFTKLSVRDHIAIAAGERAELEWAKLAEWFPILLEKRDKLGGELSGGQQQILSIARAMAASPRYILLDEPSIGLSPIAIERLSEAIATLKKEGVGILLAEQNASLALSICDRCYLLIRGEIRLSGTPAELRGRSEVEALYLGRDPDQELSIKDRA